MARKRRRLDSITFEHSVWIGDVEIVCEFTGTPDQGDGTGFELDSVRPLESAPISAIVIGILDALPAEEERLQAAAAEAEADELARSHDD